MMEKQSVVNPVELCEKLPAQEMFPGALFRRITEVEEFFQSIEIASDDIRALFVKTVGKIVQSGFHRDLFFGSVMEGSTISGGTAEVTRDHCIRIDAKQLNELDEDIAMALIAHELAHDHLRHFKFWDNNLENEQHADNLARTWGFDIDRFRKVCGPSRLNNRLLKIHCKKENTCLKI